MTLTLQASRTDSLPLFCVDIELNGKKNGGEQGILDLLPGAFFGKKASVV